MGRDLQQGRDDGFESLSDVEEALNVEDST
jgi:hypothetical protein